MQYHLEVPRFLERESIFCYGFSNHSAAGEHNAMGRTREGALAACGLHRRRIGGHGNPLCNIPSRSAFIRSPGFSLYWGDRLGSMGFSLRCLLLADRSPGV